MEQLTVTGCLSCKLRPWSCVVLILITICWVMSKMLSNASFLPCSPKITLLSFNKQQHKTVSNSSVPKEGIQVLNEHYHKQLNWLRDNDWWWYEWKDTKIINSSHLRTMQVCGEHNDRVCQHVCSVGTGKQSLSAREDTQQHLVVALFYLNANSRNKQK